VRIKDLSPAEPIVDKLFPMIERPETRYARTFDSVHVA